LLFGGPGLIFTVWAIWKQRLHLVYRQLDSYYLAPGRILNGFSIESSGKVAHNVTFTVDTDEVIQEVDVHSPEIRETERGSIVIEGGKGSKYTSI